MRLAVERASAHARSVLRALATAAMVVMLVAWGPPASASPAVPARGPGLLCQPCLAYGHRGADVGHRGDKLARCESFSRSGFHRSRLGECYQLFVFSNQWTARTLHSAGLPFVPKLSPGGCGRVVRLRDDCQAHAPPDQTARGDPLHAAARIDSIWVTARSQSKAVVMCSRPAPASRARSAGSSTRLAILAARSSTSRRRATRAVTPSTA
jgi:hypothetical protein